MKIRTKYLIASIAIVLTLVSALTISRFINSNNQLASCYYGQVGSSSSLLQINNIKGQDLTGSLIFQNYEKDSSYGEFSAKYVDNQVTASFTFQSEGTESNREIIFTKEGDNLIGDGFTYQPTDSCNSILFNQGLGLIPFDMKLPLHLFPQLKLQPVTEEQLTWTFGPGGFKPTQSLTLIYKPEIGEPVNAITFYLWQKAVWDVIADPNQAPDWGRMIWSDQSHVFSVNGVQDCVYPNKPDCDNITEIFNLIYEKDSYINRVPEYKEAQVTVTNTKTFQDPETGFYVLSQFKIIGIKAEQSYRCDITAFDINGNEIISWKTEGLSFPPNPSTPYSGQTNITPDQVPLVKSSTVTCLVADSI
jgi:hypothetical protein